MFKKNNAGFTLFELIFTTGVLVFALAGLLGAFVGSFGLIDSSRGLTIAVNHAQCVLEEIRDRNIPALVTTVDWTAWASADVAVGGGGCNGLNGENIQVTYPAGAGAVPLNILVTVNWTERGGRLRNVAVATLLAER